MRRNPSPRITFLDWLRGLLLLSMMFYHLCYDLVMIFGLELAFFFSPFMHWLQTCTAGAFILLAGVCCCFSRSNLRRGFKVFGCGMLLTLITALAMPSQLVLFGVLHLLGVCMILFGLLRPVLERIPVWAGAAACALLFLLTLSVSAGSFGGPFFTVSLPASLYEAGWLFPLGFPSGRFFSSDYFPLFPWFFLFLCGSFLGRLMKSHRLPGLFYRDCLPWLSAMGRHSLWIYLLHQPVLYGVLWLVFTLF